MDLAPLVTAFSLVFLAELGDKTALAILLLSSRGRALPVILGAWAAFFLQGLIALGLGSLLAKLPPDIVRFGAAAVFLGFGLLLILKDESPEEEEAPPPGRKLFAGAFLMVFIAEFGDATQIGSAALVARLHAPWMVFIGATLALWSVALLMATVGKTVGKRLPVKWLRRGAGCLFIGFALLTAARG